MHVTDDINPTLISILNSSEGFTIAKLFSAWAGLRLANELWKSESAVLVLASIICKPIENMNWKIYPRIRKN